MNSFIRIVVPPLFAVILTSLLIHLIGLELDSASFYMGMFNIWIVAAGYMIISSLQEKNER